MHRASGPRVLSTLTLTSSSATGGSPSRCTFPGKGSSSALSDDDEIPAAKPTRARSGNIYIYIYIEGVSFCEGTPFWLVKDPTHFPALFGRGTLRPSPPLGKFFREHPQRAAQALVPADRLQAQGSYHFQGPEGDVLSPGGRNGTLSPTNMPNYRGFIQEELDRPGTNFQVLCSWEGGCPFQPPFL